MRSAVALFAALLVFSSARAPAMDAFAEGAEGLGLGLGIADLDDASTVSVNPSRLPQTLRADLMFDFNANLHHYGNLLEATEPAWDLLDQYGTDIDTALDNIDIGSGDAADLQLGLDWSVAVIDLIGRNETLHGQAIAAARLSPVIRALDNRLVIGFSAGGRAVFGGDLYVGQDVLAQLALVEQDGNTADDNWQTVFSGMGGATTHSDGTDGGDLTLEQEDLADALEATMTSNGVTAADAEVYADEIVYQGALRGLSFSDPQTQQALLMLVAVTSDPSIADPTDQSVLLARGVNLQEAVLGAGYEVLPRRLNVGANVRLWSGESYSGRVVLIEGDGWDGDLGLESEDRDEFQYEDVSGTAVDLAATWTPLWAGYENPAKPGYSRIALSLAAKNINGPSFDLPDGSEAEFAPQLRAGAAARWGAATLFVDSDLMAVDDPFIDGVEHQYLGGGVHFRLTRFLSLRAGARTDLAEDNASTQYAAGMRLRTGPLVVAVAAGGDSDTEWGDLSDFSPSILPNDLSLSLKVGFTVLY